MRRKLSLKRETLTALTADEMSSVAGGSHLACTVGHGPSFDESCPTPTLPVFECPTIGRPCLVVQSVTC